MRVDGEFIRRKIYTVLKGGKNTSVNYDETANEITIETSGGSNMTSEKVEDIVSGLINGSGATSVSYDDKSGKLTINSTDQNTQLSNSEVRNAAYPVGTNDLGFNPATQGELNSHAGKTGVHHSKYTNSQARSAVENMTFQSLSVSNLMNITPNSSTPSSPAKNDVYLDDGTNTSNGSVGFRYYDGSAWTDI